MSCPIKVELSESQADALLRLTRPSVQLSEYEQKAFDRAVQKTTHARDAHRRRRARELKNAGHG